VVGADEIEAVAWRRIYVANMLGGVVVTSYLVIASPDAYESWWRAVVSFLLITGLTAALSRAITHRIFRGAREWWASGREPTPNERATILRIPTLVGLGTTGFWFVIAASGGVLMSLAPDVSGARSVGMVVVTSLAGAAAGALSFVLAQWSLRPVFARVLRDSPPGAGGSFGVHTRLVLFWALGSALPVVGILASPFAFDSDRDALVSAVALGVVALIAGFGFMTVAARSVAAPLTDVRRALDEVGDGRLDVEIDVDDDGEIGSLQAGVNRMVIGLRERESLRDLFGRHVGEDVARDALERGVELGGEVRDVAVLFVDITGSTQLAATRPAIEVVELLNEFFAVVVEVVAAHRGFVNKFEGDAALAVFGAPIPLDAAADQALAGARSLAARLGAEVPECAFGIGVAAGPVVAGNIGAESRFEYTVIGDPVNEAARLTELAKSTPGSVLASAALVAGASAGEAQRWLLGDEVVLRGRSTATRLATPAH